MRRCRPWAAARHTCGFRSLGGRSRAPLCLLRELLRVAFHLLPLGLVDLEQADLALAAEADALELGGGGAVVRPRRGLACLVLEPAEPRELVCELARARRVLLGVGAQRVLEPRRERDGGKERLVEPVRACGDPPQQRGVGSARRAQVCDPSVGGLGLLGGQGGLAGFGLGGLRLGCQLGDLAFELPLPRLQPEQDRLGGLAGEPELAALWVVAEALVRDRRDGRGEESVDRDDRQLGDALGRPLAHEHGQAAEPGFPGVLEQREARGGILGHDGRCTPPERRRHGALGSRLDVQQGERELGSFVCERPRRGGNPFALGKRALERRQTLLRQLGALGEVVADVRGRARRRCRLVRSRLELRRRRPWTSRGRLRLGQLDPDAVAERGQGLGPHCDPLSRRAEPVERSGRALVAADRLRHARLELLPLASERVELLLGARRSSALERCQALLGSAGPLGRSAALGRRVARRSGGLGRGLLEPAHGLARDVACGRLGLAEIVT